MSTRLWTQLGFVAACFAACSGSASQPGPSSPPLRDAGSARDAARHTLAADSGSAGLMTAAQLRDPESCKGCHPTHYREWSSSMHAYSALDPVFVAMNKRGQRETGGALGDFCVRCHAPMAVADGLTRDGLNLAELPDQKRGVSCYFCHNAVEVQDDHNGKLRVAGDNTMRGPLADAVESGAHRSAFTELFDHAKPEHNAMCGGCHDIVLQNGVELERTYREFQGGLYAMRPAEGAPTLETCASCHMRSRFDVVAVAPAGAPKRPLHEHLWPGVDVALTDFPNRAAMRSAVEDCQLGIASIAFFTLEVTPPNTFTFKVETNAGHNQPSGAAQDRRMWLEIQAFDADGKLIPAASSGVIGDREVEDRPAADPQLWMFRDRIFNERGEERHMFWEAAPSPAHPRGYEPSALTVRTEMLAFGTHAIAKAYKLPGAGAAATPARIQARLRMRPIGMDVLQDLVASGDLDPALLAQAPTFSFGAQIEWSEADGFMKTIEAK
ncbi:MAG TPA: multiheme c-type cytochrome, partial [Polyangiales bacterium]|nr:multiheme c-type cytochrome [Polyangiales bacterium]